MKVVEHKVVNRGPAEGIRQRKCEDALVITDDFAAVIDGVSSLTSFEKSPGRWASERVAETIQGLDYNCQWREAINQITESLKDYPSQYSIRPGASAIIYSVNHKQLWKVGDVGYLVNGQGPGIVDGPFDRVMTEARALMLRLQLANGRSEQQLLEESMTVEALEPWHKLAQPLANSLDELGYGLLNGTAVPDALVDVITIKSGDSVVMATDGYPKIFETLEQSEQYLAQDLARDPLRCRTHPGYRAVSSGLVSFDDRAYLRLIA